MLSLPASNIRQDRVARAAVRLAEEQQEGLAALTQRIESHGRAVQTRKAERRSRAVDGKPGRPRPFRCRDNAQLRLDRVKPRECPAVLAKQLIESEDAGNSLPHDDQTEDEDGFAGPSETAQCPAEAGTGSLPEDKSGDASKHEISDQRRPARGRRVELAEAVAIRCAAPQHVHRDGRHK